MKSEGAVPRGGGATTHGSACFDLAGEAPAGPELKPWAPLPSLEEIRPEHIACALGMAVRCGIGPREERKDFVQEVLLEAHRCRGSRLDVRALLFGITKHRAARWYRRRRLERDAVVACSLCSPVNDRTAEDEYQAEERRQAVHGALATLPEMFRQVFVRAELEGAPMAEIAAELGIPVNTGYTRLHLARGRFLSALLRQIAGSRHRHP